MRERETVVTLSAAPPSLTTSPATRVPAKRDGDLRAFATLGADSVVRHVPRGCVVSSSVSTGIGFGPCPDEFAVDADPLAPPRASPSRTIKVVGRRVLGTDPDRGPSMVKNPFLSRETRDEAQSMDSDRGRPGGRCLLAHGRAADPGSGTERPGFGRGFGRDPPLFLRLGLQRLGLLLLPKCRDRSLGSSRRLLLRSEPNIRSGRPLQPNRPRLYLAT